MGTRDMAAYPAKVAATVLATVLVTVLAVVGTAGGAAAAPARHRRPHGHRVGGLLVPANGRVSLPRHGGTVDSLNWSGYAVDPGSGITGVTGTFRVPSAGLIPPGFAATWAGIGGYSSSDLIQAGVSEQSLPGPTVPGQQYYAWFELLPTASVPLTGCSGDPACTVHPGDTVTVDIHRLAGTTWRISVTDSGGWSWSKDVAYVSTGSSAEWILEAPTLAVVQTLLAPVGTVQFGPTSTYEDGGTTHTIAQGTPVTIDLGTGLFNEAIPSALAPGGQSFNACAYALTCPAP